VNPVEITTRPDRVKPVKIPWDKRDRSPNAAELEEAAVAVEALSTMPDGVAPSMSRAKSAL